MNVRQLGVRFVLADPGKFRSAKPLGSFILLPKHLLLTGDKHRSDAPLITPRFYTNYNNQPDQLRIGAQCR